MENNDKIYKKNEALTSKLNICYYSTLSQPEENDINDNINPIFNLLAKFKEIITILNTNDKDTLKFLYFNRIKAHKILYESEENISIEEYSQDLNFYVYLSLLIEENPNVVNYTYSLKLIQSLSEQQTREKNQKIKKIILAKIIIELIANYEQIDSEDNADNKNIEDVKRIKIYNIKVINENIKEFEEFISEEAIFSKRIDEIYAEIIKFFILKEQLCSVKTYDLIKQIDLESIYLTKIMFNGLSSILIKNEVYIKAYIIKDYDDLFDIKKINFYYILLKYILKYNYYIYQIPFLSETRNKIKKIINANIEKFKNSIKQKRDQNDKIEYVLKCFIEYDYYYNKSIKAYKEKIESTSRMVSNSSNPMDSLLSSNAFNYGINGSQVSSSGSGYFSGESFKKAKERSGRTYEGYEEEQESEFDILKRTNKDDIVLKILIESNFEYEFYKENNETKEKLAAIIIQSRNENINIETVKSKNEILDNNYKNLLNFIKDIISKIKSEFTNNFDFKVNFNFKSNNFNKNKFNTYCYYKLNIPNEKSSEFKDANIFNIKDYSELEGITLLVNEINARRD